MSAPRLTPGRGRSPRLVISMTDAQRQALDELAAKRKLSTAQLTREALDVWLAAQAELEEVAQAS
jgi:hypothetical protein